MEGHAVAGRGRRPCMVSTNGKPWVEARGADGETQETLSPPPWAAGIKPGPSLIALVPEHMEGDMASCKASEPRIVLEMSLDEARAVCVALGYFSGKDDPTESPFDALHNALSDYDGDNKYFKVEQEQGLHPVVVSLK